jgi:hypothetical protein
MLGVVASLLVKGPAQTPRLLDGDGGRLFEVRSQWSLGNVAVLVRHAERCDRSEAPCWQGEDGITIRGRDAAIALSAAFKHLPLQHVTVYNSPALRTSQTAVLAFPGLSESPAWLREDCRDDLYHAILRFKEQGRNLILVTHSTCIRKIRDERGEPLLHIDFRDPRSYGVSVFLAVDQREDRLYPIGYLRAEDWAAAGPRLMP